MKTDGRVLVSAINLCDDRHVHQWNNGLHSIGNKSLLDRRSKTSFFDRMDRWAASINSPVLNSWIMWDLHSFLIRIFRRSTANTEWHGWRNAEKRENQTTYILFNQIWIDCSIMLQKSIDLSYAKIIQSSFNLCIWLTWKYYSNDSNNNTQDHHQP